MTRYVMIQLKDSVYQGRWETEDREEHRARVDSAIMEGCTHVAIYTLGHGPSVVILDTFPSYESKEEAKS